MDTKLSAVLSLIQKGEINTACVYRLLDSYYDSVVYHDAEEGSPFPEELLIPVESRESGVGEALSCLLDAGHDVDASNGGFNGLMLAVGNGDAPMVHYLIARGADANSWPDMDEDVFPEKRNYYLENIDIHYMNEGFANDKDEGYLQALRRTALVLAEDARLGPYYGYSLQIDEDGNVTLSPAETRF